MPFVLGVAMGVVDVVHVLAMRDRRVAAVVAVSVSVSVVWIAIGRLGRPLEEFVHRSSVDPGAVRGRFTRAAGG